MGFELFTATLLLVAQAVFMVCLPFAILFFVTRFVNAIQDAHTPWTPYIEVAALAVGVTAGIIVLFHIVDPRAIRPSDLLRVGGPWDIDFATFFTTFANPLTYDISSLLPPYASGSVNYPGIVVFLLGGALFYGPFLFFRSRTSFANAVRNLIIMLWAAYTTIFLFFLSGWMLNRLNFWVFLVLMIVIHKLRGAPRIILKVNRRSF